MRIAYLILAHADPPQLQRLINTLHDENASFFVHIDKKADIRPFITATAQERNVRFVQARVCVNWGGFSVVEGTLALMRQALDAETHYDYIVLLSGSHYPIKSRRYIREYFQGNPRREFVRYVSLRDEPFMAWKISMLWFNEHVLVNRVLNRGRRLKIWGKMQASLLRRRQSLNGFEPYVGGQWWALTQDCVRYILDFVERNCQFVDFYRLTYAPDEMFFHTIILNSKYAENTNERVEYEDWSRIDHPVKQAGDNITFTRWVRRPAVLDEHDFPALEKSDCLFARKFASTQSSRLMDRIDKYLLR